MLIFISLTSFLNHTIYHLSFLTVNQKFALFKHSLIDNHWSFVLGWVKMCVYKTLLGFISHIWSRIYFHFGLPISTWHLIVLCVMKRFWGGERMPMFRVLVLTFKVLNSLGPLNLQDCLTWYTPRRALHLSSRHFLRSLAQRKSNYPQSGPGSFFSGPNLVEFCAW